MRISDFGLRIADCGLRIAECGLVAAERQVQSLKLEMPPKLVKKLEPGTWNLEL
jgi:hypothetical protein